MTTTKLYTIVAAGAAGTPFDVLYGSADLVFATEADAEAQADAFNDDDVWGPKGDKTPAEVGLAYLVEEVDADELEGEWLAQARRLAFVS